MTEATAPGKLILVGEYAVLYGAPALSTSIEVRASAQVAAITGSESILFDAASGQAYYFLMDPDAGLQWAGESPGQNGLIVEAVIACCLSDWPALVEGRSFRISLNTDAFFVNENGQWTKLGVGSSAAVLVALVGGLARELGLTLSEGRLMQTCHEAHRRFQGGKGSGLDVATALYGGVVSAHRDAVSNEKVFTSHQWPDGLHAVPIWTGTAASTPELMARCESYREQHQTAFNRHIDRLSLQAEQACDAWAKHSVIDFLGALSGYDDAISAFDADAKIGISTDAHQRIRRLAEQHGAVYKVSGAGGGDFGIALTDTPDIASAVRQTCAEHGLMVLDADFAVRGLSFA